MASIGGPHLRAILPRSYTLALENAGGRQGNAGLTPLSAPLPTPSFEESRH